MAIEFSRRTLLNAACCGAVSATFGRAAIARAVEVKKTTLSPDQALASLKEGNERFVANPAACFEKLAERRREIALGQAPFAAIVACSDSRVPPELLFGRGLGELFVIRVAGNTVDTVGLGSISTPWSTWACRCSSCWVIGAVVPCRRRSRSSRTTRPSPAASAKWSSRSSPLF